MGDLLLAVSPMFHLLTLRDARTDGAGRQNAVNMPGHKEAVT